MTQIDIRPVDGRRELQIFLTFPWQVFRGDPLWVPPLLPRLRERIDPATGAWYRRGFAEFFLAWSGRKPVGTICCAVDERRNEHLARRDAIFGLNHYLRDYAIAAALWDHARSWARQRHLDTLVGPYDLDYEDSYGILIEGYDRPPALLCGHSPPYYREFVTRYGFRPAKEQNIALEISLESFGKAVGGMAKLYRVAKAVQRRGHVTVRPANLSDWNAEVERVLVLLNDALCVLPQHVPWSQDGFEELAKDLVDLIDPELALFGEVDGQAVGFLLGLPNLNQALIHANGLRYPWDKLRAWWALRHKPDCLCIKSILVLPKYWGRGIDALMLYEMGQRAIAKGYRWVDLSITGLENPMTPRLAARLGARIYKHWQVYAIDT